MPPSLATRLLGLGSVFGKTLRDLRLAAAVVGIAAGLEMLVGGLLMAGQFPDAASRLQLKLLSSSFPPIIAGLLGDPQGVDRLGGFLAWRIGSSISVIFSIWSIVAMSGTIAGEAGRGTLEVVLASPITRRRLAAEKAAAFVVALVAAMGIATVLTWLTGVAFARIPGDEIGLGVAAGQWVLYGVQIGLAGALAFALGSVTGRATAAVVAGTLLFAAYLVDGFSSMVPLFETLRPLSWFAFTRHHRPLAGGWDWGPVAVLALLGVGLLAAGSLAFQRRDLGSAVNLRLPGLPRWLLGTSGPLERSFGERLPHALAWGAGTAVVGLVFALSSQSFTAALQQLPQIPALSGMLDALYPGVDWRTPAGFLQVAIFSSGMVLFGLAAATAVSGWASDEAAGRLEVVLATPVARARWVLASGAGTLGAAVVVAGVMGIATALGTTRVGGDPLPVVAGIAVLGLYMAALTGIGLAVGGWFRPGLGGPVVIVLTIVFYLLEVFGSALDLPDWVLNLSLNHHMGLPMVGQPAPVGLALCLLLTIGGVAAATAGLARRDLRG